VNITEMSRTRTSKPQPLIKSCEREVSALGGHGRYG